MMRTVGISFNYEDTDDAHVKLISDITEKPEEANVFFCLSDRPKEKWG